MDYLALTKYYCCSNNKTILWKWYFDQQAQEQMFKFEISGMGVIGRFNRPLPLPAPLQLPAPYLILPLPD